jgi:transposase
VIHTADTQDRDGAPVALAENLHRLPWLRHIFADGGYAGDTLKDALRRIGKWTIAIIKRSDAAIGFEVLPRARYSNAPLLGSIAIGACQNFEQTIASATAWLFLASAQLLARRFARLAKSNA